MRSRNQIVCAATLVVAASLFAGCNKDESKSSSSSGSSSSAAPSTATASSGNTVPADKAMDMAKNLKGTTEGKMADAGSAARGAAQGATADAKAMMAGDKVAVATIAPAKGAATQPANQTVAGTVTFTAAGDGVKVVADLTGLSPGKHGIHIHEKADVSAPDLSSAGGHWDPDAHKQHGGPMTDAAMRHAGDLGNIEAGADGKAHLEETVPGLTVGGGGKNDVVGHSVVVHAKEDDLKTAPAGNSGGRVAAGAIEAKK